MPEAVALYGRDLFGDVVRPSVSSVLRERYVVPPFSVLSARDGEWQDRKRQWKALGLDADDGTRDGVLGLNAAAEAMARYSGENINGAIGASTSIFDPVLCEVAYSWFCPPGGLILDPFAGEATKGIVAGALGYRYAGIELRQDQVETNTRQAAAMELDPMPLWLQGDSAKLDEILEAVKIERADMVWTSPPYYDLEIYSKSDKDGSAFATYSGFMGWYQRIFTQCVERMANNRFLAVKVGEIRDERGAYRNFVGDNIACFRNLGLHYYNEIILITAVGSAAMRAEFQFKVARKIAKTHQNVLVFWKGDPRKVKDEFRTPDAA